MYIYTNIFIYKSIRIATNEDGIMFKILPKKYVH